MARVMVTCPTTRHFVSTGVELDPEEFQRLALGATSFRCAACGQLHTWSKADAYLEAQRPGARRRTDSRDVRRRQR